MKDILNKIFGAAEKKKKEKVMELLKSEPNLIKFSSKNFQFSNFLNLVS